MVWLSDACAPVGLRLYAIGDVHGCLEQLQSAHEDIRADLACRPVGDWRIIHVGDYIDRGPDSRNVVEFLAAATGDERIICLRGNHDQMLLDCLAGEEDVIPIWRRNGAAETLESYGLNETVLDEAPVLAAEMRRAIPKAHIAFFDNLPHSARYGDYFFCHAGIEPGLPLAQQTDTTLIWIRDAFLKNADEHEAVIIHGHTPADTDKIRPNRINIDTGAVYGGPLSCLVLEGREKAFLRGPWLDPVGVG